MLTLRPADRELDLDTAAPLTGIYWAERTEIRWSPSLQSFYLALRLQTSTSVMLAGYPSHDLELLHALMVAQYFQIEGVQYRYRQPTPGVFCRILNMLPHGPSPKEWLQCMPWSCAASAALRQQFRQSFEEIASPLLRQYLMLEMSNAGIARQLWREMPDGAVAAMGYHHPGGRLAAGLELAELHGQHVCDSHRAEITRLAALLWFVHFPDHHPRHGWRMLRTVWPAAAEELVRRQPFAF